MKSFDAVKTMRGIRDRLSERYRKDAKQQIDDLNRIRKNIIRTCYDQQSSDQKSPRMKPNTVKLIPNPDKTPKALSIPFYELKIAIQS